MSSLFYENNINNNYNHQNANESNIGNLLLKKWQQKLFNTHLFSIQQWPSADGQSANAIIYFDDNNYYNYKNCN